MSDILAAIRKLKEAQAELNDSCRPISVIMDNIDTMPCPLRVLVRDVKTLAALPGELRVYRQGTGYNFPYGFEKVIDNVLFRSYGTAEEAAFYLGLSTEEEEAKSA
jgi:hypothetical protein